MFSRVDSVVFVLGCGVLRDAWGLILPVLRSLDGFEHLLSEMFDRVCGGGWVSNYGH